jgi:hypothetical protein
MEPHETVRRSVAGYIVVLLGVAGWVAGCFLPLYQFGLSVSATYRLSEPVLHRGPILARIGNALYLFGTVAAILVICVLGMRSRSIRTEGALVGAVLVWTLVTASIFLSITYSSGTGSNFSKGIGYWCLLVSAILVVVGTVMVVVAARRQDAETDGVAPPVERS